MQDLTYNELDRILAKLGYQSAGQHYRRAYAHAERSMIIVLPDGECDHPISHVYLRELIDLLCREGLLRDEAAFDRLVNELRNQKLSFFQV